MWKQRFAVLAVVALMAFGVASAAQEPRWPAIYFSAVGAAQGNQVEGTFTVELKAIQ